MMWNEEEGAASHHSAPSEIAASANVTTDGTLNTSAGATPAQTARHWERHSCYRLAGALVICARCMRQFCISGLPAAPAMREVHVWTVAGSPEHGTPVHPRSRFVTHCEARPDFMRPHELAYVLARSPHRLLFYRGRASSKAPEPTNQKGGA